jgi:hypothetical protein
MLRNDTIQVDGRTLYRIRAIVDLPYAKKGEIGGYIEKESNLSHQGGSWLIDNAMVFGNAKIWEEAAAAQNVMVFGNASLHGDVNIFGNVVIQDNVEIYGKGVFVHGHLWLCGDIKLSKRGNYYGDNAFKNQRDFDDWLESKKRIRRIRLRNGAETTDESTSDKHKSKDKLVM